MEEERIEGGQKKGKEGRGEEGKKKLKEKKVHVIVYSNLLKIRPWVMNLSSSTKRGVGVFSRVVIFLHPLHMQLVCLVMYAVILQCLFRHALA